MASSICDVASEDLISLIKSGKPLADIASSLDTNVHSLRKVLKEREISIKKIRPTLTDRIAALLPEWKAEGLTLVAAAKSIGISQQHLSNTLRRLGLSLSGVERKATAEEAEATSQVIQQLMTKGGAVSTILDDLGYRKHEPIIRLELKRRGIDPRHYFYAFRRYGDWLIIPGPVRPVSSTDKILKAKCLLCGNEFEVSYVNLISGRSKCCNSCKTSDAVQVVDITTGEIFKSIRSAAISVDALSEYQNLRYALNRGTSKELHGHTFKLYIDPIAA